MPAFTTIAAAISLAAVSAGTAYSIKAGAAAKRDAKQLAKEQLAAAVEMETEQNAERARQFDLALAEQKREADLATAFAQATSIGAQATAATQKAVANKVAGNTAGQGNSTLLLAAAGLAAAVIISRMKKG